MEVAAVFLPLLGFLVAGLFGRVIGERGAIAVTVTCVSLSALISIILFFDIAFGGNARTITLFSWINSGDFVANWALKLDTLTAVMLVVVTVVSAMVHIYSIGYMSHDHAKARFFAYLSLFTFAMLMLVTADNFIQLYFGWEGVGVASYLLIGFWYHKPSANRAAIKAFLVNRVGDFGLALGIFAVFKIFGSVHFDTVFDMAGEMAGRNFEFLGFEVHALTTACVLLFIGAMGKSAQLGLHTWLPDAMEGPTPVSALIHAATMVTAGVFLIARLSPIFEYAPVALVLVTVVGAATALVAATIGMTQFDIKRVIAYSTMSQLGYMFFALGVSAYQAAIFHLMTHAFFKALLFLGAGSVIHAMSDEQDMRKMGGIWRKVPYTYAMMWIGSLALAGIGIYGVFGLSGFYSKDIILEAAWARDAWHGTLAYWVGVSAAFMTAFYSFRLIFMTFHGKPRADEAVMAHVHESPVVMLAPLVVLAVGSVLAGAFMYDTFVYHGMDTFWGESIFVLPENMTVEFAHNVPLWVKLLPVVMAVLGIALAFLFYIRNPVLPELFVMIFRPIHRFVFNKWYFDELYDRIFVKPAFALGWGLWKSGDGAVIDGIGPDGVSRAAASLGRKVSQAQTGFVYHYASAMLIGVVVFVTWYLFRFWG
ncbi:NADH-quinone oxidoreductase subunit L [Fodinicurvata sp. EGI_FJ10296]|uniref:NADH-quinone oxidoreductase subunit L n=1 Tax=Fodinicurvata sp. EGI_FJ10296 TaxID=3231908 RepID=UPI0034538AFB